MLPRKLLLSALLCSVSAAAEKPPQAQTDQGSDRVRAAAQFLSLYRNEMDCENVGYIQTGEADEHFAPIFRSSDTDGSKSLSKNELMNNPFAPDRLLLGLSFVEMDFNKDDAVTADELRIYLNSAVTIVDSDADGDVYPVEYEHAMKTGRLLQKPVANRNSKEQSEPDFVPPWIRHVKALNHMKSKGEQASKTPQTATTNKQ
ncbi:MAG: hypothetical protein MI976_22600 [Pseudomonadales bacterium]|nr:hypothetical protein [Pseudomonadales bacterium]